jgi:hypothetical protein
MTDKPRFNYDAAEIVGERLGKLFEGLNKEHAMAAIEEFIDDYTHGVFGIGVIDALRKVSLPEQGRSQSIQPLAGGRAILVSAYGFNVKTDTNCKCGRAFIVLDEMTREDRNKEMESMG